MEFIKKQTFSIKHGLKDIHTKKPYLEMIAAALTIPVLLTVIVLNINNLKGDDTKKSPEKEKQTIVITQPSNNQTEPQKNEVIITKEACKPGIGDIEIPSPNEGQEISNNPVEVNINYNANGYCAVVWSYRINSGPWSSYDDSAISLYNLTSGNIRFELRVKSVVDSSQENFTRNFIYSGSNIITTITPTVTATPTP